MRVRWNEALADWAKSVVGDRSLRQLEIKTGISHMTIRALLDGRQPSPETIIRFASAFEEDVAAALRLAGYEDLAETWETGAAPQVVRERADGEYRVKDEFSQEEEQVIGFYRGLDAESRETVLKTMELLRGRKGGG